MSKLKIAKERKRTYQARMKVNRKNDRIQELAAERDKFKRALQYAMYHLDPVICAEVKEILGEL